jgi:LysM repeat protein
MIVRAFILLILAGGIGGGAWYAYNKLYSPPVVRRVTIPDPPGLENKIVDPLDAPMAEALTFVRAGDIDAALSKLMPLLPKAHTSPRFDELKTIVGELNVSQYISAKPGPGKTSYTVARGDSISKISGKFKVPADLIVRVNNMTGIDLQIGQEFVIPQGQFSAIISPSRKTLTVFQGLEFFKEYQLRSATVPRTGAAPGTSLKVGEKISWSRGERVAFGAPAYHAAARWISLGVAGASLFTVQPDPAKADVPAPATGFGLDAPDMNELFLLLPQNSIVQITE